MNKKIKELIKGNDKKTLAVYFKIFGNCGDDYPNFPS